MATFSGCGENSLPIVSTDQDLLKKFIHIPVPADRVKFELIPSGTDEIFGPREYRLIAMLFYSDSDFEEASKISVKGKLFSFEAPDWLKEDYWPGKTLEEGELRLENIRQVDPEPYFRSPYLHGEVTALDRLRALLVTFHTQ